MGPERGGWGHSADPENSAWRGARSRSRAAPGWLSRAWTELALRVSRGQWLREAAEP